MNTTELKVRERRAVSQALVVIRGDSENEYIVYSASSPNRQYVVGGDEQHPTCTCLDYLNHQQDPNWRCKHILAAFRQSGEPPADSQTLVSAPEPAGNGGGQLLIRRSASPDGRIDSVTIEWTVILYEQSDQEITDQAIQILTIADQVIDRYLGPRQQAFQNQSMRQVQSNVVTKSNGNGNGHGNGSIRAKILSVGGMEGRWGRRLYLQVESEAGAMRLFGSVQQLAAALVQAGYPHLTRNITEGAALNVPCRVTTKPSDDGRFQNIDEFWPPEKTGDNRRGES